MPDLTHIILPTAQMARTTVLCTMQSLGWLGGTHVTVNNLGKDGCYCPAYLATGLE